MSQAFSFGFERSVSKREMASNGEKRLVRRRKEEEMNPETNKFEKLSAEPSKEEQEGMDLLKKKFVKEVRRQEAVQLLRPNGEPVPKHWSIFKENEYVIVKDYTFKVAHIGESYLILEPVGPIEIGKNK